MHIYEILKRPVITEKSVYSAENLNVSRYAFEVDMRANKLLVKDAVETAFNVVVDRVHIMVMPIKTANRGRRIAVRKPKWKKAIVTLAPGNTIQLFEGV
jgi:large subunit ribosomal protein L23